MAKFWNRIHVPDYVVVSLALLGSSKVARKRWHKKESITVTAWPSLFFFFQTLAFYVFYVKIKPILLNSI
jgi:hypothetical protein